METMCGWIHVASLCWVISPTSIATVNETARVRLFSNLSLITEIVLQSNVFCLSLVVNGPTMRKQQYLSLINPIKPGM